RRDHSAHAAPAHERDREPRRRAGRVVSVPHRRQGRPDPSLDRDRADRILDRSFCADTSAGHTNALHRHGIRRSRSNPRTRHGLFRRTVAGRAWWTHSGYWGSVVLHDPGSDVTLTAFRNQSAVRTAALEPAYAEILHALDDG